MITLGVNCERDEQGQLYIDNLIAQTQDGNGVTHCDRACIINLNDGASWTTIYGPS